MARIEDEIDKIADPVLRATLFDEVKRLKSDKRFGLVFEEHLPELVPVYSAKVKARSLVARRGQTFSETFKVVRVHEGVAEVEKYDGSRESIPVDELTVVRRFGEPIYPALRTFDRVKNGDTSQPHHILIEADNYHALQLLEYCYSGKVDCIYIDPPYNTGAKDWKYNNDYVDGNDTWRHSKWLSMMQKRLLIARRLLNPADSVLIVTIDEKEYLRLGLLLEQVFPGARVQMVSSVINHSGVARAKEFYRADEYLFFVFIGDAAVTPTGQDMLNPPESFEGKKIDLWRRLLRSGTNARRKDGVKQFYPFWIDPKRECIHSVGDYIPLGVNPDTVVPPEPGLVACWPIRTDDSEGCWQISAETARKGLSEGTVRLGAYTSTRGRWSISYLRNAEKERIKRGEIEVMGRDQNGALILKQSETIERIKNPVSVWNQRSHNAGAGGSNVIRALIPGRRFPFPKSLYAVEDALRFFVKNKPEAMILDFFAGSGTTAHAVMRLNRQDGGWRQCISVTNNEVAADEQAELREQGVQPGDLDWEKWGICRYITKPRLEAAMTGITPDGEPINGDYKFTDEFPIADGFPANLEYFKLDFLDPAEVQMGRQFAAILPILWMIAGARGPLPDAPNAHAPWLIPADCPFAVLIQERRFKEFHRHIEGRVDLTHVYIVTNSASTYHNLREELEVPHVVQLYKDYLQNFKINYGKD